MKKLALLVFCLYSAVAFAQNYPEVDYPYADLIEKGNLEKAEKKILKEYQKDSNDVLNCYAMYRLLSEKSYMNHNDYKAYTVIVRAYELFKTIEDKAKNKLFKKNVTEDRLLFDIRLVIERGLQDALAANTIDTYEYFLSTYKQFATEKQKQTAIKKRNTLEFYAAKLMNTVDAFQAFIDNRPTADEVGSAIQLRNSIAFSEAVKRNTIDAYKDFIDRYPDATEATSAQTKIHNLAYKNAETTNTEQAYLDFVKKYPNSKQATDARVKAEELHFFNSNITFPLIIDPNSDDRISKKDAIAIWGIIPDNQYGDDGKYGAWQFNDYDTSVESSLLSAKCIKTIYNNFVSTDTAFLERKGILGEMIKKKHGIIISFDTISPSFNYDFTETTISGKLSHDGTYAPFVAVSCTLSINSLIDFAKANGVDCDLAYSTFGLELRKYNFFKNTYGRMAEVLPSFFIGTYALTNPTVIFGEPYPMDGNRSLSVVPLQIEYKANENTITFYNTLQRILNYIAIPQASVEKYRKNNFKVYEYDVIDYSDCEMNNESRGPYNGKLMFPYYISNQGGLVLSTLKSKHLCFYGEIPEEEFNIFLASAFLAHYSLVSEWDLPKMGKPTPEHAFHFCKSDFNTHFERGFMDNGGPYGVWEKSKFGYISNIRDHIIGLNVPLSLGETLFKTETFNVIVPNAKIKTLQKLHFEDYMPDYGDMLWGCEKRPSNNRIANERTPFLYYE